MKKAIAACIVLVLAVSLSGCCKTLEQAVRTNTENSRDLAKTAYTSNLIDELKKEMVLNYASLRCMRDVLDKTSTAEKDSDACACQRYGAADFGKCQNWFNK